MSFTDPAVTIAIVTLITTIVGFVYTWFKDSRDRKWRIEDEAMKSQHLADQDSAIAAGTRQAEHAYTEANQVNMKIVSLQEQLSKAISDRDAQRKTE